MLSRRDLFASALALATSNGLPVRAALKLQGNPFSLGVASGEPVADGIVLWTRLAPKPTEGGGMPDVNVPVKFVIAEDEQLRRVVTRGTEMATPMLAHSVHVEASGLKPGRWYWYRFEAAGAQSPVGRFRTAPARTEDPGKWRIGVASCQQWSQGLWTAYQHMSDEDLDLVLHLGDYIYEKGYKGKIRPEGEAETFTLTDYRNRHALYKTDPLLQRAHQRFAWATVWDDHEVANNHADWRHELGEEKGQPRTTFLERRASAYQAYYEHLPLRLFSKPVGSRLQLYRRLEVGGLARIHLLDTRQYRSDQPCGDNTKASCAERNDAAQTLMGAAQEQWLAEGLRSSAAKWDVLAQQIFVTLQDFDPSAGEMYNMDSWSGYPLAQKRLSDTLEQAGRNAVILTGDVHANWACQLHREAMETNSKCLAAEFVSTSISSGGDGVVSNPRTDDVLRVNPQIKYFNGKRGYLRCEVTAKAWRTDYRTVEFVTRPGAPVSTAQSLVVEPGDLRLQTA